MIKIQCCGSESRIRCLFEPWTMIRDRKKSGSGSGIRNEQPGSYFRELGNHFSKRFGGSMPLFLFIFIFFYNIHTVLSSNHIHTIHSPRPLSISSSLVAQWERPPCGAEPGIELGHHRAKILKLIDKDPGSGWEKFGSGLEKIRIRIGPLLWLCSLRKA